MLLLKSALFLTLFGYTSACACHQYFWEGVLRQDPIYKYCHHPYLTRIKLSRLAKTACSEDDGCQMKAEVIEDFFGPLKEADRRTPNHRRFIGYLGGGAFPCGVPLPEPGDYITNAFSGESAFRENACTLFREPYSDKLASEIRRTVKKCPKQRLDSAYWEEKARRLAQSDD